MVEARFTPGPWVATNKEHATWHTDVRSGDDGCGRRVATTFVVNAPNRKRGESLAGYRERYDRQARQNEANARLIAAAPDLLEALQAASWLLADISPDGLVKQKVDAAIAKALNHEASKPAVVKCQCGKPADTKYDGDDMCRACASDCAWRDFEEGDMPGGFGEA